MDNPFKKKKTDTLPIGHDDSGASVPDTESEVARDPRKGSRVLIIFLVFILAVVGGYAAIKFALLPNSKDVSGSKQPVIAVRPIPSAQPLQTQPIPTFARQPAAAAPQLPPSFSPNTAGAVQETAPPAKPSPVLAVKNNKTKIEGRDVFKDFYFKHPPAASKNSGGESRTTENALAQKLQAIIGGDGVVKELPSVKTMGNPGAVALQEIKVFGITCFGSGVCLAITDKGAVAKGETIGDETVKDVRKNAVVTDKRTVIFN